MGQQQLLVVILVTIIIGIASIVAVTTFESAAKTANRDAITHDMNTLAAEARDYYQRPENLGGGGRTFTGFSITGKLMPANGITESGDAAQTENGTLEVLSVSSASVELIAHPSSCEGYLVGTIDEDGILTNPGTCEENDQVRATVRQAGVIY